jgi:Ca-activated chloride channel family protein
VKNLERESLAGRIALDLIGYVLLAAALGVVTAVALASVALLFASQAEAAEAPQQGTLLLRPRGAGEPLSAPLLSTAVAFHISGMVARAEVVQTFRNSGESWVEGVYVFPLPETAAVDHLRLHVGERSIEGEIEERAAAQRAYDAASAQGRRSALLDQERPNIFTARVANIGPHETIVVELQYQEALRYRDGRFSLRFPMVVGPRYIPRGVADAARITPVVLRPSEERAPVNPVSIRVDLDAGLPLAEVSSPYHRVDVRTLGQTRREITLAEGSTPANRDFVLQWAPRREAAPQLAWFTEKKNGRYYALLMLMPSGAAAAARLPREVIFVLDTSGSMAGTSIRQAREALVLALRRLAPADRFNVIEFNSSARALFPEAREASSAQVGRAISWVRGLEARGGTEMAGALNLALDGGDAGDGVRQVVFLTDGTVGNEEGLFRLIKARLGDSRLFTVGIGSAPNGHFMRKAAELGRGTFTYIGRIDEVGEKMAALFAKLEAPVLKGITLRWPEPAHAEAWPARVPDLYAGEPLVISAALERVDGELRVNGVRGGHIWEARVPLSAGQGSTGMGTLWARAKVASLIDSMREGAAPDQVRAQVIALAMAHRLVTRYTSFVAIERAPARPAGEHLARVDLPTNLPEGWEYDKVFGELPQSATDSRFALLTGMLCLLLAAALHFWRRSEA